MFTVNICSRSKILLVLLVMVSTALFYVHGDEQVTEADPPDMEFLAGVAQGYYDALVKNDFQKTAEREIFILISSAKDINAYCRAMKTHPYVGAESIKISNVTDSKSGSAYLKIVITREDSSVTNNATWSYTGTPPRWVAPMTKMTMAGMPGHEVIPDDYVAPPKEIRTRSTIVRDREHNQQDALIEEDEADLVRFISHPKVMPAMRTGQSYVLGMLRNKSDRMMHRVMVTAVVRAESGEIIETATFKPQKLPIAPGAKVLFSGYMTNNLPKQTTFSIGREPSPLD